MNACAFCKRGKRKCNKARPSCSNCLRLRKACVYTEDTIQTHYDVDNSSTRPTREPPHLHLSGSLPGGPGHPLFSYETPQQSIADITMRILGSLGSVRAISEEFFTGTHQRIPTLSKLRFNSSLDSFASRPRADFAALCLSIIMMQQMPLGKTANMQSPLYMTVKSLISWLETSNDISLDFAHCRILVTFYEMGHGLHTAAYISVAACARTARALGLHRKTWRSIDTESDMLALEEEKRTWWAIVNMERFIGLCSGDALFATPDPERTDPLPIEDLLWSEGSLADLHGCIIAAPSLDTSFNITVGQMARECQISHLAGRVVRHVFDPTPNPDFNAEEAIQLERTMRAYLPLLADEELRIGKYCGAFGVCNSALFTLYEYLLSQNPESVGETQRVLKSIEETALRVITFAEASYGDREENYPFETISPYLPYSLCQAAIIQHRLWKHSNDPIWVRHFESLKDILRECTKRWMVAWQYLEILEKINESWPSIAVPFQGSFISTGKAKV